MNIRYDTLSTQPTKGEIQQFFAKHPKARRKPFLGGALYVLGGLVAGYLIGLLFSVALVVISDSAWLASLILEIGLALIGAVVVYQIQKSWYEGSNAKRYQLYRFARDNNLAVKFYSKAPAHPGMIFNQGDSRHAKDQLYTTSGDLFEIGNYYYTTGSGKSRHRHDWGYVCAQLKRNVPNMVLDSKGNNIGAFGVSLSNLPYSFDKDQTLSLEGNFNDYFTLYAPKEYERDALYIFTPDLMSLLIDNTAQCDVEVVDNRLYVYSAKPFDMLDRATLQRLFSIISTVGEKTIEQTDRYADERVGNRQANRVAQPGKRLKHGVPAIVIVLIVLWVLFNVVSRFF